MKTINKVLIISWSLVLVAVAVLLVVLFTEKSVNMELKQSESFSYDSYYLCNNEDFELTNINIIINDNYTLFIKLIPPKEKCFIYVDRAVNKEGIYFNSDYMKAVKFNIKCDQGKCNFTNN